MVFSTLFTGAPALKPNPLELLLNRPHAERAFSTQICLRLKKLAHINIPFTILLMSGVSVCMSS